MWFDQLTPHPCPPSAHGSGCSLAVASARGNVCPVNVLCAQQLMHFWDLGERRDGERKKGGRYLKSISGLFTPGVLPGLVPCCPLTRDTVRLLSKGCREDLSLLDTALAPGRERVLIVPEATQTPVDW